MQHTSSSNLLNVNYSPTKIKQSIQTPNTPQCLKLGHSPLIIHPNLTHIEACCVLCQKEQGMFLLYGPVRTPPQQFVCFIAVQVLAANPHSKMNSHIAYFRVLKQAENKVVIKNEAQKQNQQQTIAEIRIEGQSLINTMKKFQVTLQKNKLLKQDAILHAIGVDIIENFYQSRRSIWTNYNLSPQISPCSSKFSSPQIFRSPNSSNRLVDTQPMIYPEINDDEADEFLRSQPQGQYLLHGQIGWYAVCSINLIKQNNLKKKRKSQSTLESIKKVNPEHETKHLGIQKTEECEFTIMGPQSNASNECLIARTTEQIIEVLEGHLLSWKLLSKNVRITQAASQQVSDYYQLIQARHQLKSLRR